MIEGWSRNRSSDDAVAALRARDIPAGPVWDLQQALGSDQAVARELVRSVPHPAFGSFGVLPQPAKFQREPAGTVTREPLLGEHTDEVLPAPCSG